MTSLIQRLNSCLGMSPDEIVANLSDPWIVTNRHMSAEDHDRLCDTRCAIAARESNGWRVIHSGGWNFWFEWDEIRLDYWSNYAICPDNRYFEGSLPRVDR